MKKVINYHAQEQAALLGLAIMRANDTDEAIERHVTGLDHPDTVYQLKGSASPRALVWATGAKLGRDEADEARRLSRIIERDKRKAHFMQTIRGANMGSK